MIAGGRARVCERCLAVGAGVGASLESPGGGGKAVLPTWHFIQEGGVNSSFPAVSFEVKQKCLADACVFGVVFVFYNGQTIKCNVWRGWEGADFYSFRMFSWLLFPGVGVVWVLEDCLA